MFKWYGTIGIILILFGELNFIFKIEPFAFLFLLILTAGYILVIDALIFKLRKESMICNRFSDFIGLFILSVLFWYFANLFIHNISSWVYSGSVGQHFSFLVMFLRNISDGVAFPAVFETIELLKTLNLFKKEQLSIHINIKKATLLFLVSLGVVCLLVPFFWSSSLSIVFVWISLFLILDPINYLHRQPSIVGDIREGKFGSFIIVGLGGMIVGFLWEFWNYWAVQKWTYNLPFLGFLEGVKIFEMPLLGYLGYAIFAFEIYAVYWFVRSLFVHKEHLLEA